MKTLTKLMLAAIVLCAAVCPSRAATSGADKSYLDVDDVINLESAGDFDVSRDGAWVVWVKTTANAAKNKQTKNVYLSAAGGGSTIQLTRGEDDTSPKFSPGGRSVAFLSKRGGGEPQIYLLDLRGGEAKKLTDSKTGVNLFEWVDEDRLLFAAREDSTLRERTLKQKKDDAVVVADQEHYAPVRLFEYSVKDGKTKRLSRNQGVVTDLAVSPDGRWVVTTENQDVEFDYNNVNPPKQFLTDLNTRTRREIFTAPHVDPFDFEWDSKGQGFYCRRRVASDSTDTYVGISELYYYSAASDRLQRVDLGWRRGLGRSFYVIEDGVVVMLANGVTDRVVHAAAGKNGRYEVKELRFEKPVRLAAAARHGNRVIYFSSDASTIPEVRAAAVSGGKVENVQKLFDLNEKLKGKPLSRTEVVRWAGARGDSVEGILYYPPAYTEGTVFPLVVLLHGGPAGVDPDFFTERWSNYPHVLSARGTFVLKVNYHGSGNYGLEWVESIKQHYYEYEVPDVLSGVNFLVERGLVDGAALGIMGWSNGSILAIACCIQSDRFKALCAGAGDVNWTSDYGNCAFGAAFDNAYFGGPPWGDASTYVEKSPLFQMEKLTTPTLILFGAQDKSVPTEQGWQHFRAMRAIGKAPVRFLLFPGAGHGLTKPSQQKRKMQEELEWLGRHLFKTQEDKNEALDETSPLALELKKARSARVGRFYGREAGGTLVPEIVELEGLRVGRFEVTRVQFGAFDPNYTYPPGTDNYPVSAISFPMAQAYCIWLGEKTGRRYRLPTAAEMEKLLSAAASNLEHENNLERWAGMTPTPDELALLKVKIGELEGFRLLIEPVGSSRPVGAAGVYDLGGNVAEWVTDDGGKGIVRGLSAVSVRGYGDDNALPPLGYIGFRVLEE